MTIETFEQLLANMQTDSDRKLALYNLGVDMIGYEIDASIVAALGIEAFGKEGWSWIEWYMWERPKDGEFSAWDENKNPICYDIPSLFQHVTELNK